MNSPVRLSGYFFFFFNDTATTEIYTLSLHDALPICQRSSAANSTNQANGTDQVFAWMYTRGEYSWPRQRAKSRTAAATWPAENAALVSDGAAARSRDSTSQDRSLVCHGQM